MAVCTPVHPYASSSVIRHASKVPSPSPPVGGQEATQEGLKCTMLIIYKHLLSQMSPTGTKFHQMFCLGKALIGVFVILFLFICIG